MNGLGGELALSGSFDHKVLSEESADVSAWLGVLLVELKFSLLILEARAVELAWSDFFPSN